LTNTEPTVLAWDWTTPYDVADTLSLMVVLDSPADLIPKANKIPDISELIQNEKQIGLRSISRQRLNCLAG
jgi:hypothetical protein